MNARDTEDDEAAGDSVYGSSGAILRILGDPEMKQQTKVASATINSHLGLSLYRELVPQVETQAQDRPDES